MESGFLCFENLPDRSGVRIFIFFKLVGSVRVSYFFVFNFIGAERSQDFLIFLKHQIGAELGFFETVFLSERSGLGQNRIFGQSPTIPNVRTNSSWKCLVSNTKF